MSTEGVSTVDTTAAAALAEELVAAGHRYRTSVPGVWSFGADHEQIVAGLVRLIEEQCEPGSTKVAPAPLQPLPAFESTNYIESFPQLTGVVHTFLDDHLTHQELLATREDGADWQHFLRPSQVTLVPAVCHTIYPIFRGQVVDETIRATGWCFRHEPSPDPMRLVAFRMHEVIRIGSPEDTITHREHWLDVYSTVFTELGLDVTVEIANDPFFGRAGKILASGQRSEALKFEVLTVVHGEAPTAIASGNAHRTHFGDAFDLRLPDGSTAHSSCAGVGLERATTALLAQHGMDIGRWPAEVRDRLGL